MKTIFFILFVHWIADFVLQTDKQAKGKSKNWSDLLEHTICYSLAWCIPLCFWLYITDNIKVIDLFHLWFFIFITFISHTITDYFTSRLNTKLWQQGKTHQFFVSVGFDQLLHYFQLFITYEYVFNI